MPTSRADPTRNTVNKEKNQEKKFTRAKRVKPNIQLHTKLIDKTGFVKCNYNSDQTVFGEQLLSIFNIHKEQLQSMKNRRKEHL